MTDIDMAAIAADMEAAQAKQPVDARIKAAIKNGDKLTVHPIAEKFPLMADEDPDGFASLKENIIEQGEVFDSIKIGTDGQLYDGRNRVRAVTDLLAEGIEVRFEVEVITPIDVKDWIISTNLHRRHLTDSQRAFLAAELAQDTGMQLKEAAEKLSVPPRSAKRANAVLKNADEETKDQVKKGEKKVATALRETTGKKQGSKTKAEYQKEAPPKADPPAKKEPAAAKAPAKKRTMKLNDASYQELRLEIAKANERQLEELMAYVRGLLKVAKKK